MPLLRKQCKLRHASVRRPNVGDLGFESRQSVHGAPVLLI